MKNLKEFKALIERYETIQLPEIEAAFKIPDCEVKKYLTGFGNWETCSLCQAVSFGYLVECSDCMYEKNLGCIYGVAKATKTYESIDLADTPKQLLTAYRNRAKFMRKLLREKINALKGGENGKGS